MDILEVIRLAKEAGKELDYRSQVELSDYDFNTINRVMGTSVYHTVNHNSLIKIMDISLLPPEQNAGKHNIFFDYDGVDIPELWAHWGWKYIKPSEQEKIKPFRLEPGKDLVMWPGMKIHITFSESEGLKFGPTVHDLTADFPDIAPGSSLFHHSWVVKLGLDKQTEKPEEEISDTPWTDFTEEMNLAISKLKRNLEAGWD